MRPLAAIVLILGLVACVTPTSSAAVPGSDASTPSSSSDRIAGWRSDLDHLLGAMDSRHPDLFHGTSRADLELAVDDLNVRSATATDDELMVGVARTVALVSAGGRDAHTGLYPWSPASGFPVHSLPLRLWLFPDGVHIVDALAPYERLSGARVDTIAGHPILDVLAALDPLIPRDNASTVRLLTPRYLLIPEVLHGLGLIAQVGPVTLGLADPVVGDRPVDVIPIPMVDYNEWAGPYGLHLPSNPDVLYLSRMDEPLWWTRPDKGTTLFVQYNEVRTLRSSLVDDMAAAASAPDLQRVAIDIRHNTGGEVRTLEPVLAALASPELDRPDGLFLITGRNTFSAASLFAAKLQAQTSVTVVGEPMGGSPNAWGNARDVTLGWTDLVVSVATLFELATTVDDRRLTIEPDQSVALTFPDWAAGRDAALEAILDRD